MISLAFPNGQINDLTMIAVVTASHKLPANWFDVVLVALVAFGFWRGRINGMTKEIVPTVQWLAIVTTGGFCYKMLGDLLLQQGVIRSVFGKSINEKTAAYLSAYILIVVVIAIFFSLIKGPLRVRLEGSTIFGSTEYYYGMISGIIRYACILIFFLAMLNAPYYSAAEIQATKAYNNRWFGGGLAGYSGDYFPTISELQITVFKDSLTGPFIQSNLNVLLVNSVPPGGPVAKPAVVNISR
jgi:uncharacterized membrane protein required for colicin V production